MEVHCHFIREKVFQREFEVWAIKTNKKVVDPFTKGLRNARLANFFNNFK